jgi:lambda family phage portal protein
VVPGINFMGLISNIRNLFGYGSSISKTTTSALVKVDGGAKLDPFRYSPLRIAPKKKTVTDRLYDLVEDASVKVGQRIYDGAIPTNTQSDWNAWLTSENFEIFTYSRRMRALARNLEDNNAFVKLFLKELSANVLGYTGINIASKVPNQKGKNLNAKVNSAVHKAWKAFRKIENYEVRGMFSGVETDRQILQRLAVDGEVIIKLVTGKEAGNPFNFTLQVLEADFLNVYHNDRVGSNRVVMGVELTGAGRPVGYWLTSYPQMDLFAEQLTQKDERFPAEQIIHIFLPSRFTANRGMSWLSPVVTKLRTLDRFEENVAIARRIAASKMAQLVTTEKDAEEYKGQGRGPAGEIIEEISPGIVIDVPYGKKYEPIDIGGAGEPFGEFRKEILRTISGGLGMMYSTLAQDAESINYSSARFFKDVEEEWWRELQRFYFTHVLQPIFESWLPYAILSGEVPGVSITQVDDIIESVEWDPKGFSYVDPTKEISSSLNAISGGLTSRRRELAKLGINYEEFLDEVAADQELEKAKGVSFVNPSIRQPEIQASADNPNNPDGDDATGNPQEGEEPEQPKAKPAKKPKASSK